MAAGDSATPDFAENIEERVEYHFGPRRVNAAQDDGPDALVPAASEGLEDLAEVHASELPPRVPHRRDRGAVTAPDHPRGIARVGEEVIGRVPGHDRVIGVDVEYNHPTIQSCAFPEELESPRSVEPEPLVPQAHLAQVG